MKREILNKRAFERFSSDMAIWVKPQEQNLDFILVEITNISAGGLMFKFDFQMKHGDQLDLRFELPQNNDLVEAVAVVRHVVQKDDEVLIGVQFVSVKNYTIPVLMAYLEALFR